MSKLLSTKCNFHIVFFEGKFYQLKLFLSFALSREHALTDCDCLPENREIPTRAASDFCRSRYALGREVILQHLRTYLQGKQPEIQVLQFPAVKSPEFQAHVQAHSVYFVMCHNGALRKSNIRDVRSMLYVIHNVVALGLDVAIINEIEWRDIKVYCYSPLSFILLVYLVCKANTQLFSTAGNDESDPRAVVRRGTQQS